MRYWVVSHFAVRSSQSHPARLSERLGEQASPALVLSAQGGSTGRAQPFFYHLIGDRGDILVIESLPGVAVSAATPTDCRAAPPTLSRGRGGGSEEERLGMTLTKLIESDTLPQPPGGRLMRRALSVVAACVVVLCGGGGRAQAQATCTDSSPAVSGFSGDKAGWVAGNCWAAISIRLVG